MDVDLPAKIADSPRHRQEIFTDKLDFHLLQCRIQYGF